MERQIRIGVRVLASILGIAAIGGLGFGIWYAAMLGVLGSSLTPHGEDKGKLTAFDRLLTALHAGMPGQDAKAAIYASGGKVRASAVCTLPNQPCISDDYNFILTADFGETSWHGVVRERSYIHVTVISGAAVFVGQEKRQFRVRLLPKL